MIVNITDNPNTVMVLLTEYVLKLNSKFTTTFARFIWWFGLCVSVCFRRVPVWLWCCVCEWELLLLCWLVLAPQWQGLQEWWGQLSVCVCCIVLCCVVLCCVRVYVVLCCVLCCVVLWCGVCVLCCVVLWCGVCVCHRKQSLKSSHRNQSYKTQKTVLEN